MKTIKSLFKAAILPIMAFVVLSSRGAQPAAFAQATPPAKDSLPLTAPGRLLWIHGKQAGELGSLPRFVELMRNKVENPYLFVTAATNEGVTTALTQLKAEKSRLLTDGVDDVARLFEQLKPQAIMLLEHELPLNLLLLGHLHKVPMYLFNAQFADKTAERLANEPLLYKQYYQLFKTIYVQSEVDRTHFMQAGIPSSSIKTMGNIKAYNVVPRAQAARRTDDHVYAHQENESKVLLAGSVHRDEIDHYLTLLKHYKPQFPSVKMIIAPRYFDWKDELVTKVKALGYRYFVWDAATVLPLPFATPVENARHLLEEYDVLVVVVMGKLFDLTALSDIYYPGGTFNAVGGHNVIDPAVWAKPIIIGPHHENTKDIVLEIEKVHGIVKVTTAEELTARTGELLAHPESGKMYGKHAYDWVIQQEIAVNSHVEQFAKTLKALLTKSPVVRTA